MSYGSNVNVGKIDNEQLRKNIEKILQRIDAGLFTIDDAITRRYEEISMLKKIHSKGSKARIEYIKQEIFQLEVMRDA